MTSTPYQQITWSDPVTGCNGYLVIDRLVRGVAGGGLRMRPGCTLGEVTDLARAMSIKEVIAYQPGAHYVPFGGAKGGIDFDPNHPDASGVLKRYMDAMLPIIRHRWATGEDLGVRQDDMDVIAAELGLSSTCECALRLVPDGPGPALARLQTAFAVYERGISLGDLVGGYGVAQSGLAALRLLGRGGEAATAVVQGFGSMGGASARYLNDAGVNVIAIADRDGLIHNPGGLDVELLLRTRSRTGGIDRTLLRAEDQLLPGDRWSSIECDLVVPAATSYAIDIDRADGIRAAVVVEAANVASSDQAQRLLQRRGVPVVPDFIANMATNAWWWWTLFGDIEPTAEASFVRIRELLSGLVEEAYTRAERDSVTLRDAGLEMARERSRAAASANSLGELGATLT
jgi:glutamate dehydrogenase (NAD(P)+)